MTLNENNPNSATLVSEMYEYQQETREEVNDLSSTISGAISSVTTVTSITNETLASTAKSLQHLLIDVDGTLSYITGANAGDLAVIKMRAGHSLTVSHSAAKAQGDIFLSGAGSDLSMAEYDTLMLVNINGDAATGTDGYWEEITRNLWV